MPVGPAIIEAEPVALADSELLARLFRALGDATRLRVLELLLRAAPDGAGPPPGSHPEPRFRAHELTGVVRLRAEPHRGAPHPVPVTNRKVGSLLAQAERFLEANEAQIACCRVIDATPKKS